MLRRNAADAWGDVTAFSRAVVAKRLLILAGIPLVVTDATAVLKVFGVDLPTGLSDKALAVAAVVLNILGLLAGTAAAHRAATPADPALNPVSSNGLPLVESAPSDPGTSLGLAADPPVDPEHLGLPANLPDDDSAPAITGPPAHLRGGPASHAAGYDAWHADNSAEPQA